MGSHSVTWWRRTWRVCIAQLWVDGRLHRMSALDRWFAVRSWPVACCAQRMLCLCSVFYRRLCSCCCCNLFVRSRLVHRNYIERRRCPATTWVVPSAAWIGWTTVGVVCITRFIVQTQETCSLQLAQFPPSSVAVYGWQFWHMAYCCHSRLMMTWPLIAWSPVQCVYVHQFWADSSIA